MKIVIVSNHRLPTSDDSTVEGGGLRVGSLAQGLRKNGLRVIVAVPRQFCQQDTDVVVGFESVDQLRQICATGDAVISSNNAPITLDVFRSLPERIIRIADAHVPTHVELSARDNGADPTALAFFDQASDIFFQTMSLAHAILVASEEQKTYYTGILFALKKINPQNYRKAPILITPLGAGPTIGRNVVGENLKIRIAWWGGFYPWFDYEKFCEICRILDSRNANIRFQVIGAVNPMVDEKTFSDPAIEALDSLASLSNVSLVEWVPYSQIASAFESTDLVICLNKIGPETSLSWRTRFVNLLEHEIPLATNGGDPFGEKILDVGAGFRLTGDASQMAAELESISAEAIARARSSMRALSEEFSWKETTKQLSQYLQVEQPYKMPVVTAATSVPISRPSKFVLRLPRFGFEGPTNFDMFLDHATRFGVMSALKKTLRVLTKKQKMSSARTARVPQDIVLLHQIDMSGAPIVGLDLARAIKKQTGNPLEIITPVIRETNLFEKITFEGIGIQVQSSKRKLKLPEALNSITINSCAVPRPWIIQVCDLLKEKPGLRASFFVHEHVPEIYLDISLANRIRQAQADGLKVYVGSKQTLENLRNLHGLGIEGILTKYLVEKAPEVALEQKTQEIRVCLVGPTADNRKRQLDTLTGIAMAQAMLQTAAKPHRKIKIDLVGVGNDTIGTEVRRIAELALEKGSFQIFDKLARAECLELISKANVVVSMSDNESFALYIGEAMSSGAIVLRTKTGGYEETVLPGNNGWLVNDVVQLAGHLSSLADTSQTSNQQIIQMLQTSKDLIKPWLDHGYESVIRDFLTKN
jgi:glycosyltransferase involved in cell wall biosynthesis